MPGWSQNPFWVDEADAETDAEASDSLPLSQPAPPPAEKKKEAITSTSAKKRASSSSSAAKKKNKTSEDYEDLSLGRNLFLEEAGSCKQLKPARAASLLSFLSQRGTSGFTTQRDLVRAGDYYIELRVYNSQEVENEPNDQRWKRALVTLKLCTNVDTAVWRAVSSLVQAGKEEFKSIQPIMYPKK